MFGSRCKPIAYACRMRMPANAHPSEAWLSLMRKYVIKTMAWTLRRDAVLRYEHRRKAWLLADA
jgi:hypothetical protein